jgi:hypothetical protein
MHKINITTDELSYMLELLNNEHYTGNTNAAIMDTLTQKLDDAFFMLSEEEHMAKIAHYSMMMMFESERGQ